MKKVIIGFTAFLFLVSSVGNVSIAANGPQDVKKASTEEKKDCSKGTTGAACGKMKDGKACDAAKCKEGKCDAACKAKCEKEGKKCDMAKSKDAVKK
jgi:hypothetical protein